MRRIWTAALGSAFIAACGGGGGDDVALEPSVAIAAANQDVVARTAVGAVTTMSGAGGGIDLSTGASAAGAARAFAARIGPGGAAGRKAIAAAGRASPLAIPAETVDCTVSGSLLLTFNDADNDGNPSAGDRMTMAFDACRESATEMVDGSMTVTMSSIGLEDGLLSFSGETAIDLVATDGARSASIDGAVTLAYAELSATQARLRMTVGNAGLSASTTIAGTTESISFDPDFVYQETATMSASSGMLQSTASVVDGSFSASAIGGRVQLVTQEDIRQNAADAYPRAGSLRVVGRGSALRLTALDATTVHVQLDANGDGNYEANKNVLWTELLPR